MSRFKLELVTLF